MTVPQLSGAAEVLRASQKDEEYLRYMRNLISDLAQRTLGIPFWLKWKDLSNNLSDVLFFGLTTLSGLQTIGEEYANIIQIDRNRKAIPSKWTRFMDVGLQTFGYYSLLRLRMWLENYLNLLSTHPSDSNQVSQRIISIIPIVFKVLAVLHRIHLISFYFSGDYYSVSKRLVGIKHAVIRRWLSQTAFQRPYRILGWLAAIQLCVSAANTLYSAAMSNASTPKQEEPIKESHKQDTIEVVNAINQCSLCFEKRIYSTITPCGHLFCWSCIAAWMQSKEECPMCRENFPPSKLLLLQNYW